MVDIKILKDKISKAGLTITEVAERVGVDKSTFYRKLNTNGEAFSIKQANAISVVLDLTGEEVNKIFFASKSHKSDKANKQKT
ncbi:MAG: helix-turn-helix domain-containing protein [Tissierellia bacterium]|nr:helix-turn-helix domain-containing protein [Tissierellia bacterium]